MIAQTRGSDSRHVGRVLLYMCCILITLAIFQQLRGVESCRSFLRNSARPVRRGSAIAVGETLRSRPPDSRAGPSRRPDTITSGEAGYLMQGGSPHTVMTTFPRACPSSR
jgi:hypothetical protein